MTATGRQLSRYELWYGRNDPPVERRRLRAGGCELELEQAEVRSVWLGPVELLRGIYMAVRDEDWGTVPGELADYEVQESADGFTVSFRMTHRQAPLAFTWRGLITGERSGTVSYELDGTAQTDFRYCRIGFCLLHPPEESAGQPYRGVSPRGTVQGELPREIAPQLFERGLYWPLFASVSELTLELASGVELRLEFEGDLFETEDQRNWTDASFKTYCTPQELGYPFNAHAGQEFHQKVTLSVAEPGRHRASMPARAAQPGQRHVELAGFGRELAPLGHALPCELDTQSPAELQLLRLASPSHLRVDLNLSLGSWASRLAGAADAAGALGCGLEVAAFMPGAEPLGGLVDGLAGLPVVRLLMFTLGEEMSDSRLTRRARELRDGAGLRFPVIGGTDLWFAELNRARPEVASMDGLVYTITPQVHAFDEASIVQSLEAQPETLRTARTFAAGLPVHLGAVTLRPRDAIDADRAPAGDQLPFSVDPRQSSLFAAAWTVGSLAALGGAGAASLTYYETAGPRGIIAGDATLPAGFVGAPAGGAFPAFHVFADVAEVRRGAQLRHVRTGAGVAALAVAAEGRARVLVANLKPEPTAVAVGPFAAEHVSARMLDETTGNEAMADPLGYRARPAEQLDVSESQVRVELLPFAVATLDAAPVRLASR